MIQPHGSAELKPLYAKDPAALQAEAATLPRLTLNSAAAANAVMLGGGYFNPLPGYMDLNTALSVAETMHTPGGLLWPVPILNLTSDTQAIQGAQRVALYDPHLPDNLLAVQTVENIETLSDSQLETVVQQVFDTTDSNHPGVATFTQLGRQVISGPIEVLNYSYFEQEFPDTFRTAVQIREAIAEQGWQTVVAFQTRNPMHRAHEVLCKMAQEAVNADAVLIHMLLGKLKAGDIPANVRDQAIRVMVEHYFPKNTVMISGYGFDMLYAGPREAVLHAIFRQNAGCSHLIVGRDHAGVGDYYGPFDAQTIFDTIPAGELQIKIFKADHTAYSKKRQEVVMMRDAPDHTKEDFILLSGTKVREMLSQGIAPPPEFTRPEVAQVLMAYYQQEAGNA